MELKNLFGLPAHPLVVHLPIVLIPLVSIGAVAIVAVPRWRARIGWILVALAGVALVGVQLAIGSGEALQDYVDRSAALRRHTELAESLRPLALLLLVALLALMLLERARARGGSPRAAHLRWSLPLAGVVLVVASVVSTIRLVQVGHNGARASWGRVNLDTPHRVSGGGDRD